MSMARVKRRPECSDLPAGVVSGAGAAASVVVAAGAGVSVGFAASSGFFSSFFSS